MLDYILWIPPLSELFSWVNLQLLLLAGSGILAVSLLVLALTHWGHSRPVWKCVLLSFVAHLLLLGYAYGTRLIWDTPPTVRDSAIVNDEGLKVTLVAELDQALVTESPDPATLDQPQTPAAPQMDVPAFTPLVRPELDSDLVVEPVQQPSPAPTPAPVSPQAPPDVAAPNDFDLPQLEQPEQDLAMLPEGKIIDPQPVEIPRPAESSNDFDGPVVDFAAELPRPKMDLITRDGNSDTNPLDAEQVDRAPLKPMLAQQPTTIPALSQPVPTVTERLPEVTQEHRSNMPNMRVISRTRRLGDGKPLPSIYSLRDPATRLKIAQQRGGSIQTEEAVTAALRWMSQQQREDGRWDPTQTGAGREDRILGHNRDGAGARADTGITALATLAFLGAGNTHMEGEYRDVVAKALNYLKTEQKSNGDLSGNAKLFARMYCHSMSLLALSEAYAMTGDNRLAAAVRKGVEYSEQAQNPTHGGWRYQPGDSGDMSQFGWQVMALHSAELGGVKIQPSTSQKMKNFLRLCSSGVGGGLASYRPNQGPTSSMTAEALLCRFFLEKQVDSMTVMEAQRKILTQKPSRLHVNLYYWYYGTMALYQSGGSAWQQWNDAMKSTLLALQVRDGDAAGSWEPTGMWGGYGGQVYSTAMATLNLEVYYRYLPVYQELARNSSVRQRVE